MNVPVVATYAEAAGFGSTIGVGAIHGDDARLAEDAILSISNLIRFGA